MSICLSVGLRSKRKRLELSAPKLVDRTSACTDLEIKRSKVKS